MCTVRGLHGDIMRMVRNVDVVPAGRVEPAVAGISRDQLKACGGWKSNAVDLYIQDKPGIAFFGKLLRRL